MDRRLGHPYSMRHGALVTSTTINAPLFESYTPKTVFPIPTESITKLHAKLLERFEKERVLGLKVDRFPRLSRIAGGISTVIIIFKKRIHRKALDTLDICKNLGGNRARSYEDMDSKTVKLAFRKPPNLVTAYHLCNTFTLHNLNHNQLTSDLIRSLRNMMVY